MGNYNVKLMIEDIHSRFVKGWGYVSKIEEFSYRSSYNSKYEDEIAEEQEFTNDLLSETIEEIRLKLIVLMDIIPAQNLYNELQSEWVKYKNKITNLSIIPVIGELYCPSLHALYKFFQTISDLFQIDDKFENLVIKSQLKGILRGTPKVLYDHSIKPSNETEVKNEIYKILTIVHSDTVRELNLPRTVKTYRPDIGIKSIGACIEYKFASTEQEVKTAVDGIMEDIPAYKSFKDWNTFYVVFYLTEAFYTEEQILSHFSGSKPENWEFIIVYGSGKRKKKRNIIKK